jgi:hypothetical protein
MSITILVFLLADILVVLKCQSFGWIQFIIYAIILTIEILFVILIIRGRPSNKKQTKEGIMENNQNDNKIIYKDIKVNADIKDADNAIGMEHTGNAEFENIDVSLTVSNVTNATAFKSNSKMTSIKIYCDCGNVIDRSCAGHRPNFIECEKCGKKHFRNNIPL